MPVVGNMLADGPVGGQKKKGKEGEGEATQRLDGRGRGAISGGISMGGGALDGEERGNGASGKGWMEGVMAWLWGDKGRERRKGVRELRRGLEEEGREGEAGQG